MDQNSANRLAQKLLDLLELPNDSIYVEYVMAMTVLAELVDFDFALKHGNIDDPKDKFFASPIQDNKVSHEWMTRITRLADYVFTLRDIDGFQTVRERLLSRPLKATFYEMEAAAYIRRLGYAVIVKPEMGIRGRDFDFTASKGEELLEIEVTELTTDKFQKNSIRNKLHGKRNQFSGSNPAILICTVPNAWRSQVDLTFHLMKETFEFFRKSKRMNGVIYRWDTPIKRGKTAIYLSCLYPLCNINPKHSANSSILFAVHNIKSPLYAINSKKRIDRRLDEAAISNDRMNSYSFTRYALNVWKSVNNSDHPRFKIKS